MGLTSMSIGSLAIILVIVVLIFGTKKLRNMGGDLGGALKNFKTAMKDGENEETKGPMDPQRMEQDKPEVQGTIVNTKYDKEHDRS